MLLPLVVVGAGCKADEEHEEQETSESNVQITPTLVVVDSATSNAAETLEDSVRIPVAIGARYAALPAGTIFSSSLWRSS